MKKELLFAASLLASATLSCAWADVSFAYHGRLLDATGVTLAERSHTIKFRIYDQATEGTALWSCERSVLLDSQGQFSVELSGNAVSGKGLGDVFAEKSGVSLYIGLTVDSDEAEILPRQKLLSVPSAIWASDSNAAKGDIAVTGVATGTTAYVSGMASAGTLNMSGGLECGSLSTGSMTVSSDLSVGGTVSGNGSIPIGGIITWSGSMTSIPDGWALCNGSTYNGHETPDLRDRFIVGAGGGYSVKAKGGEESVTLTVAQIPSHTHSYSFTGGDISGNFEGNNYFYNQSERYADKKNTKTTDAAGGGQPHENRPPYYALCYIMRVK